MARGRNQCVFKEERTNENWDKPRRYSECGQWMLWNSDYHGGEYDSATCTKCRAIVGRRLIAGNPELEFGKAIRDKTWLQYTYRSIWPLKHEGKLVGFATLEHGWGHSWNIRDVSDDGRMGDLVWEVYRARPFHTKEDALLAVPGLVADGRLCAPEDAEAAVARRREADAREAAEHKRKQEELAKAREEFREALASIAEHPLSNIQREALAAAYERCFHKRFEG